MSWMLVAPPGTTLTILSVSSAVSCTSGSISAVITGHPGRIPFGGTSIAMLFGANFSSQFGPASVYQTSPLHPPPTRPVAYAL